MRGGSLDHYYHLLGIDRSASAEELKRAHRDLAQVWHPDRFTANPRLQRIAEQKLREINEAYTVLRAGGKPLAPAPPEVRASRPLGAWLSLGAQAIGVAAAVFALIMFAGGVHHWLTAPSAPEEVAILSGPQQPEDTNERPALRRGRGVKVDTGQTRISNGAEIVPPRGRRGVGRLTISNQTERDAVATLLDGNSPDAVLRMIYVSAGKQVALDGIGPGLYRLQLSAGAGWDWKVRDFTQDRTAPRSVGPLAFTQIQTAKQMRGDQYSIVLRRDGVDTGGESGDGTLRASSGSSGLALFGDPVGPDRGFTAGI